MSVATAQPEPWTVDALYALADDGMRHELLDGTLLVSPPPSVGHQLAARRLVALLAAAAPSEFEVLEATGVLVPAGLLVPDVVVARAEAVHRADRTLLAVDVALVVEIVSPSSRTSDRRWKPEAYAEARIAFFARVEVTTAREPEIAVYRLVDGRYEELASAHGEQPIKVAVPFPVMLTAAALRGPRL